MLPTDARHAARQMAAVGEPTRLMILYALADGPQNVGDLADRLGVPIVSMSHHLGVLRAGRLVEDEKAGRTVVYQLNPETFTPARGGDVGVLALGVCKLTLRKAVAASADGPKKRKG